MTLRDPRFRTRAHAVSAHGSLLGVLAVSLAVAACSAESSSDDDDSGGKGGSAGSTGGSAGSSGKGGGAGESGASGKGGSAGQAGAGGSSGGTTPGDAGAGGDVGVAGEGGAAGGGAGTGGSAGAPGDEPLLDRPVRLEHECSVGAPLAKLGLNPWLAGRLGQTSAGTFLSRGEGDEFSVTALVLSSIDDDGTLGDDVLLAEAGDSYFYLPDMVAHEGGLAVLWQEVDASNVAGQYFAALDASGALTEERKLVVEGDASRLSAAKLAGNASGYAALYARSNENYDMHALELAVMDATGTLVGTPATLDQGAANFTVGAALALPSGYAFTYARHVADQQTFETEAQTYLAFFDADGNAQGEPIALGDVSTFANFTQDLLVHDEQLIVAFTQQTGGWENSDIAHTIHLARFDLATREPIGDSVALQAPVEDQENTQPQLVAVGDDLGIVWSQGGVIYICAGCMPDNHLEFVVLDGEDWNPVSARVTLENNQPMGGFTYPQIAKAGETLLVTSSLQYHVSGEGAFGSITCAAAP